MKRDLPAYCYRKGRKGHVYFVRGRICQRIHSAPGTADFAVEYAKLMKGRAAIPKMTIGKLVADYMASARWAELAHNTRRSYERSLSYFSEVAGNVDPSTLRRVHINDMLSSLADKPTDANRKIGALSVLFEHGIGRGWLKDNPVKGAKRLKPKGRLRMPWPVDLVESFRGAATGRTLLLFEMLVGTGQRIGDVLSLRWSDSDGDGFTVVQGKTKAQLYIPYTARLRAALATAPRLGLFVICQDNGLRLSYQLAWKDMMIVRREIGAEAYDIHGLRYVAASEIAALPGMTAEHVQSITGHRGGAMVHLYAGAAMQKARASEAQTARGNTPATKRESGTGFETTRQQPTK